MKEMTAHELIMLQRAHETGHTCRVLEAKAISTSIFSVSMEKIEGMNLADFYGEGPEHMPLWVWKAIRKIVIDLLEIGIQYIDINPYNFILNLDTEKLWIIDFEHSLNFYSNGDMNLYLKEFLSGENKWWTEF